MMRGHGEGFGDLAEPPPRDAVHGTGQQAGLLGRYGLNTYFLCHTPRDEAERRSVTAGAKDPPRIRQGRPRSLYAMPENHVMFEYPTLPDFPRDLEIAAHTDVLLSNTRVDQGR